jgi:trimeric autotransporter adhesin
MKKAFLILLTVALVPLQVFAVEDPLPQYLNFDGTLLDSSSTPITSAATVVFEIYDGNATSYCLLYKETQTITPDANGEFSTKVGPGAGNTSSSDDGDIAWPAIFSNVGQVRAHNTTFCNTGYTPSTGQGRKLRVTVNGTALSPDYTIAPVPMASVAETLQGKKAVDFLASAPAAGTSILTGNLRINNAQQLQLANTGSTNFVSLQSPSALAVGYSLILPSDDGSNGQVLTTDGSGLLSWSTPSGGGAITSVFGRTGAVTATAGDYSASDITNTAAGNIGATTVQAAINELEAEKLSVAGGTMTGVLNMGALTITNLADPSLAQEAATKNYVDTQVTSVVTSAVSGITVSSAMITDGAIIDADVANVSIGKISSASAQYFTYMPNNAACSSGGLLKWSGTAWICSTSLMSGSNTDAANPGITFLNDPNTGFFAPSADILVVSTGGTEQMRIDAAGNVGLGVVAPTTKLDVNGVITARPYGVSVGQAGQMALRELVANGTDAVTLRAPDSLTTGYSLTMPPNAGSSAQVLQTDGTGNLQWMTIPALPAANSLNFAQLMDSMTLDASTEISVTGANALSITNSGTAVSFRVNDTPADPSPFVIDQNGNVGIGVSAPTELLHLRAPQVLQRLESTAGSMASEIFLMSNQLSVGQSAGNLVFQNSNGMYDLAAISAITDISTSTGALLFSTGVGGSVTEKMRVNSAGQVGIGTVAPAVDLDVNLTGVMRLKRQPSATPPVCDAGRESSVALTFGYKMCVCNGTSWVNASDGATACTF